MAAHNHDAAANKAIRDAVQETRPSATGSWMTFVPKNPPLTKPDLAEWMDFLGDVLQRYNTEVAPCFGPTPESLVGFQSKQLVFLRDKIVAGTTCS